MPCFFVSRAAHGSMDGEGDSDFNAVAPTNNHDPFHWKSYKSGSNHRRILVKQTHVHEDS